MTRRAALRSAPKGRTTTRRTAPALALALLIALALTACSADGLLPRRTSGITSSTRALALAWRTPASQPDWVPADSTRIRFVAATSGSADRAPASVRVTTSSPLPASCTSIRRRSLDSFGEDWAPAFPHTVHRCGNWAVMKVRGGWFGWTPRAPAERDE